MPIAGFWADTTLQRFIPPKYTLLLHYHVTWTFRCGLTILFSVLSCWSCQRYSFTTYSDNERRHRKNLRDGAEHVPAADHNHQLEDTGTGRSSLKFILGYAWRQARVSHRFPSGVWHCSHQSAHTSKRQRWGHRMGSGDHPIQCNSSSELSLLSIELYADIHWPACWLTIFSSCYPFSFMVDKVPCAARLWPVNS